MSSAIATMSTSSASLSFVPKSPTTTSLAPGGWRSMTTWPTDATSDVAPDSNPASSSETPSAVAVATTPATAAGQSRPAWRVVARAARDVVDEVLTAASWAFDMTFACRGSAVPFVAVVHAGPDASRASLDDDRQAECPAEDVGAQDVVERAGRDELPIGQHERVREPGRDLLDMVRDEHDRRRSRLPGEGGEVVDESLAGAEIEARRRLVE